MKKKKKTRTMFVEVIALDNRADTLLIQHKQLTKAWAGHVLRYASNFSISATGIKYRVTRWRRSVKMATPHITNKSAVITATLRVKLQHNE